MNSIYKKVCYQTLITAIFKRLQRQVRKKLFFFLPFFLFLLLNPLFITRKAIPADSPETTAVPILNNQEKISLDVKGMDIIDVLKIMATRSGMNVVIGKNVTGRVTLFLKDVNISDAFQIIIAANDLAYNITGDIVNIMASRDYELLYGNKFDDKKELLNITLKYAKAAALSQALNQMKSNIGKVIVDEPTNTVIILDISEKLKSMKELILKLDRPLSNRIFNLNYAQAEKINEKLQQFITKGIGSIKIDERTNKIAITDYPEIIGEIEKIISAFDEKTPQVLIDAQIVEVSPKKDEFSMGIDWNWWIRKNTRIISALPAPATTSAATIPNSLAFGIAATDPEAPVDKQGQYKSVVEALRVIGKTRILSSPRIMALNNQEAKILVGTKEAYITSTTSQGGTGTTVTSQTVNFVDVGIKLYVTPTINHDNFITIKVRPEISSAVPTNIISQDQETEVPIVTTSESESTIMIKDGTTIMMAGLKKDKTTKETKRLPILGDIPFLGYLFGNIKSESTKTELVIFITPHIVTGEEPFEYNSNTKDNAIKDIQEKSFEQIKNNDTYINDIFKDYKSIIFNKIQLEFIDLIKANGHIKGKAMVLFTLNQNGNLKNEPCVISSNNKSIDEIAVTSIKKASPFISLTDFEKDEETFRISLSYE